ncbi:hypothetical protein ACFXPS_33600 [Nocardia sp. NPDC059091]|uniref:hypothetical protein n=1 Tax=Nocardia sp. NPDC059091 TaxID=3346724 RepID=UPI00369CECBE
MVSASADRLPAHTTPAAAAFTAACAISARRFAANNPARIGGAKWDRELAAFTNLDRQDRSSRPQPDGGFTDCLDFVPSDRIVN